MPLTHSGWSVWITVDGEELPYYSVKVEERPGVRDVPKFYTISAWIASQVGKRKEFLIEIEYDDKIKRKTDCSAEVDFDGRRISIGEHISKNSIGCTINGEMEIDQIKRPFVFTALKSTDQETVEDDLDLDQIGTIKVQLVRSKLISKRRKKFKTVHLPTTPLSVPEAVKKATSHCVALGPGKMHFEQSIDTLNTSDIDDDFFLIFVFHYRSEDILRAQKIIPAVIAARPGSESASDASFVIGSSSNPIELDDAADSVGDNHNEQIDAMEQRIQIQEEILQKEKKKLSALKRKKSASGSVGLVKKPKIEEDAKPPKLELEDVKPLKVDFEDVKPLKMEFEDVKPPKREPEP